MRTIALVKRILLQVIRDKRTLALLFVAPLLILTLMNLVFSGNHVDPVLGIENGNKQTIELMEKADIVVKEYVSVSNIEDVVLADDLDGFLIVKNDESIITLLNDDPSTAKSLEMKVKQVISKEMQLQLMEASHSNMTDPSQDVMETAYIYGSSHTEIFDTFSPVLVGFFVFFFVFLISGIGLLNERTTGTLERLMATPIRRGEIVTAYLVGYGILALLQTVIIVLFSIHVLDMVLVGSIWNIFLINLVVALVALSLGILLSTFASSEFQMMQFIPIVIVPQVFFSGIFAIDDMAEWLQVLAKIMPLYYAGDALNSVMYKGLALAVVFIILNLFALKKYRKL